MKKWILSLGLISSVFAQESCLTGITFLGNPQDARCAPQESFDGVVSQGVALFEKHPGFLKKIQKKYIGSQINEELCDSLKQEVCDYYEKTNQPFVIVQIPSQHLKNGVLQVVIEEAKLGEIRSEGSRYFGGKELSDYIQTKPGSPILMENVVQDVAWMNQNPFRRTDAVFVPGSKPNTADLDLVTVDRWPYRVYAGADNTGTISTMRDRIFFGFDFGKTVIRDSQVSYQFSCSPNWNRFYAHTLSARIPCPWRHVAIFYGGYAQVEPSIDLPGQKEKGQSWQLDGRYRIPLMNNTSLMQEIVIGYDFKETQDWIKQDQSKIFKATADINQFMLGYELGYKTKNKKVTLVLEGYANPGGITDKNKTADYQAFRRDAKCQYFYAKLVHSLAQKFGSGWWISYDLSGQISSANLLPSEQFTLTGYNAVRGFEERILNVDNGALLNIVLETPHMSPAQWISKTKKEKDDLYFIAFFDSGIGSTHTGNSQLKTLGSIGPGIRYQYSRYITGRLDYGFQLWHHGFTSYSSSRYNFGLIISY